VTLEGPPDISMTQASIHTPREIRQRCWFCRKFLLATLIGPMNRHSGKACRPSRTEVVDRVIHTLCGEQGLGGPVWPHLTPFAFFAWCIYGGLYDRKTGNGVRESGPNRLTPWFEPSTARIRGGRRRVRRRCVVFACCCQTSADTEGEESGILKTESRKLQTHFKAR
jgi:hypothetical protein